MYLDTSDDTYRIFQIIWDIMKKALKEKFIALSSFIKRIKGQKTNILTLHLKLLGKKEQMNTKTSKKQERIKPRFEITEIETMETILKNEKIETLFL